LRSSNTSLDGGGSCRTRAWLVALVIALAALETADAIDPTRDVSQYMRDQWGTEQGFAGGPVHAIAQTTDGYLWIGTDAGLVRFDGVTFRPVQPQVAGLPAVRTVLGLATDSEGTLWLRMAGPMLLRYHGGVFTSATADGALPAALVTAMVRGRDGRLLLSSMGSGTIRERSGRFDLLAAPDALPRSVVISIAETPAGDVWMGTRDAGVVSLRGRQTSVLATGLPDRKVNTLLPGEHQELWIGTDKGVVRWNGREITSSGVPAALAGVQVLSMIRDRAANIWIGTASGDLLRVSANVVSPLGAAAGRPRGAVTALFEDRDGNLWVGSARGIERVRDGAFVTYSTHQGLPSETSGPIHVDLERRTWFAPSDGGLYWLQGARLTPVAAAELARDVVYSIAGTGRDVWIGRQRGGLTRLRESNGSWTPTTYTEMQGLAQNSVYAVHESRDGTVWAGTLSGGVSMFKDARFTTFSTVDGLASNSVSSIAEGADGTMWFGTSNGVSALARGRWQSYSVEDGLPSNDIGCLIVDSAGVVWIGTAEGLAFLSEGRVERPRRAPAALQEPIAGLAPDARGSIWVATAAHVLRAPRDKLLRGELTDADVREYGLPDGLHSVQGVRRHRSVVAGADGRVWLSLVRGLSRIDAERPDGASAPAIAHVEAASADGAAIDLGGRVRIPAGRQRLTFTYAGLSLSVPERVRFRYRLDGFDPEWSEPVATRSAVYTNLGPGSYRFRVMASNGEGEWSPEEAAVDFTIDPRIWQTTWFQLACAVAIVLGSAGLYRLRMLQIARRLNVRFEERLAERTRIAQDLHDTLLQGFVSASMQLHVAAERVPAGSPARASLDRVLQLMARVIDEGRNAVRGLRSPAGGDDLEEAFCRMPQELGVQDRGFRVVVEGRPRPLHPVIRDEVYRIGREALANAVRHSGAQKIEVEIEYAAASVRVVVRDDGRGIDEQILRAGRDGHWGLSGMRERAERMGARLTVWSRGGAGTEVELLVPGRIAFQPVTSEHPAESGKSVRS
jgi:signal transduction histidine kinase/ligand-binding sensor domain-containing protein